MKSALLILTLVLAACEGGSREAMLDNYLVRLGRAVDEVPTEIKPAILSSRPRIEDRYEPQQGIQIDLLDFLKLRSCRLQATIAHRNSILGKLALPSQRLLNSIEFLRRVGPCITQMTALGEQAIAERLQQAAAKKTAQLPALLWQALLGAEEARQFWRQPPDLVTYPEQTGVALISALEQLHHLASAWLAGDYAVSGQALEGHLQTLATGDGGALLAAMGLLSEQMQRADQILTQSRQRGPLCPQGRPSERGQILSNVVRLFLIGEAQRWSADLNRRYYLLWPAVQQLEDLLAAGEPAAHRRWRAGRDRAMETFRAAPRNHVKMLSPILQRCALAPSRPDALAALG
jgi:hypothetical protein